MEFHAHNIRLDDGSCTRPAVGASIDRHPWFLSAKRVLDTVFPGPKDHLRIADLGCLEGGYSVEFARMGFQVLGIDVRESNIAACRYVKAHTNLPNLEFARDDVWNLARYGEFDAVFCCGLLYHLDQPKKFLQMAAQVTRRLLILQTHFSVNDGLSTGGLPKFVRRALFRVLKSSAGRYGLSRSTENESVRGRWYSEFENESEFRDRENSHWSSWDNRRSFWIQKEYLLETIQAIGFDLVMEQYDSLQPTISESMISGSYRSDSRGTFIGLKTSGSQENARTSAMAAGAVRSSLD